jgi:hypothetical protein
VRCAGNRSADLRSAGRIERPTINRSPLSASAHDEKGRQDLRFVVVAGVDDQEAAEASGL